MIIIVLLVLAAVCVGAYCAYELLYMHSVPMDEYVSEDEPIDVDTYHAYVRTTLGESGTHAVRIYGEM